MQEEVENRTVNLAISTTKLTGRSLVNAFRAYLNHRRNVKARKASIQDTHIVGEQTIDQLLGQNQGATNIEIEKTEIAGFKRILNKYGVDYAITKDRSQEPPRYLVFFKARDGDALTAAFKEYSAAMAKSIFQDISVPPVAHRQPHCLRVRIQLQQHNRQTPLSK